MIRSLYTASTAMHAQQFSMDTIANNLSNVNTIGFKKSQPVFQDLLYSKLPSPDVGETPSTLQIGSGVRLVFAKKDFSNGSPQQTDSGLDVALQGNGFLAVKIGDGNDDIAYTRAGALRAALIDEDGERILTNANGYPVLDTDGDEIEIDEDISDLSINQNGELVGVDEDGDEEVIAQLGVAKIADPQSMQSMGGGLYTTVEEVELGAPGEDNRAVIIPGFLEMANVQVVEEMVNLITAQRAYEVASKAVQASDEMLGQANNLRR